MRTIEITTTQNVVIQFALANLLDRIIAFIIDAVMLFFYYRLAATYFLNDESTTAVFILTIPMYFYTLIFESLFQGRTIGKMVVGIKVIKVDGGQPGFIDFFNRWSVRFLDIILSMGSVAMISIGTSEKNQRIGGKISDTMVIKLRGGNQQYSLNDILNISKSAEYVPKYPEITQFNEGQMLHLKKLVVRHDRFKTPVYQSLLKEVSLQVQSNLNISQTEKSDSAFIRQLIKDYVVLTR
ncbi:MAG: putative RDD family membrane protein YckC [Bacteroidia bacterium]|jgi:uncharacterized RDD family membrane protein YckC